MNLTEYVRQASLKILGENSVIEQSESTSSKPLEVVFSQGFILISTRKYTQAFGLEVFRKIVRHELCHYFIFTIKVEDITNKRSRLFTTPPASGLSFVSHLPYQIELGVWRIYSINVLIVAKSIDESENRSEEICPAVAVTVACNSLK